MFRFKKMISSLSIISILVSALLLQGCGEENSISGDISFKEYGSGGANEINTENSEVIDLKPLNLSDKEAESLIWDNIKERWSEDYTGIKTFYHIGSIGDSQYYVVHYIIDWALQTGYSGAKNWNRYCLFWIDSNKKISHQETYNNLKEAEEAFARYKDNYLTPEEIAQREKENADWEEKHAKEVAEATEALNNDLLNIYHMGESAYCEELDLTVCQTAGDTDSITMDIGGISCTSSNLGTVRNGDGILCYLEAINTNGGNGEIIFYSDGIDLTGYSFPDEIEDYRETDSYPRHSYFFRYTGGKSKEGATDISINYEHEDESNDTSNSGQKLDGSTVSDYWGSWYDINDTSIGIDIIGENDIPCVQISQTGTVWQFYCDYVNGELVYEDGECFKAGENRKYLYKDGTGKFYIKDDCLYWEDNKEGKGNGYKFEKLRPQDLLEMQYSGENSEYIYEDSDSCVMTSADVDLAKSNFKGTLPSGKTIEQMIVNEIYARHGYKFKNAEIQGFFESKSWYKNLGIYTDNMNDIELNDFESKNVKFLQN